MNHTTCEGKRYCQKVVDILVLWKNMDIYDAFCDVFTEICSDHYKLKDPDHHLGNNFLSDWRLKLAGFPLDPDKHKLHLEQQLFHPGFATSIETVVH